MVLYVIKKQPWHKAVTDFFWQPGGDELGSPLWLATALDIVEWPCGTSLVEIAVLRLGCTDPRLLRFYILKKGLGHTICSKPNPKLKKPKPATT